MFCIVSEGVLASPALESSSGMRLIYIEGGLLERGGPSGCLQEGASPPCKERMVPDELPRHTVEVDSFLLCQTEVTQEEWAKVMDEPLPSKSVRRLPKTGITWDDAQAYLKRISTRDGRTYRLPTEAEWEFAAQLDKGVALEKVAWFRANAAQSAKPVASLEPNRHGLYDMFGNVWEWIADWYDEEYYAKSPKVNPQGAPEGERRVVRGGAFNSIKSYLRPGARMAFAPATKSEFTGFRCAASVMTKP